MPSENLVVGSVMTTEGLKQALLRHPAVASVETFYPFTYENLSSDFDIFIIEGWFEFIHNLLKHLNNAYILFWCLDPDFPGLAEVTSLDIRAFLTNSEMTATILRRKQTTETVYLAADHVSDSLGTNGPLIFVGSALGISTKRRLVPMLREASMTPQGLELWGKGWNLMEDLRPFWKGVLRHGELEKKYSAASFVLGATMEGQFEHRMINNRVFEALATGTPFINDLPLKDREIKNLFTYSEVGDLLEIAATSTQLNSTHRSMASDQARSFILNRHTYDQRARQLLDFIFISLSHGRTHRKKHKQYDCRFSPPLLPQPADVATKTPIRRAPGVRLLRPRHGNVYDPMTSTVPIFFRLRNFRAGKDGSLCIFISTRRNRTTTCLLQDDLRPVLHIQGNNALQGRQGTIMVHLELRCPLPTAYYWSSSGVVHSKHDAHSDVKKHEKQRVLHTSPKTKVIFATRHDHGRNVPRHTTVLSRRLGTSRDVAIPVSIL